MALGFLTNSEAKQKIEGLEARISELEADATARDEALTTAQADLATANESLSEANGNLTTARERITVLETEAATHAATVADLTEKAKHTDEKVKLEASRMVAASGHPMPVDDPQSGEESGTTMTRAQFNGLSHAKRNAVMRKGGVAITD